MPTMPSVATALVLASALVVLPSAQGPPGDDGSTGPVTAPAAGEAPRPPGTAEGRWRWPLQPQPEVLAPFAAPMSRYGPGHRGLDLAATVGQEVTAVEDGVVSHRGRVAGRGTVTVTHADGLRSTYEPVEPSRARGDRVRRGERIGRVSGEPGHCAPVTCVHLGALRGPRDYVDPLPLLGSRRVILLPVP